VKKFKIKSFCKINLSLRVLKRLGNGYHNIKSLVTFCNLHDVISISKIKDVNDKISFSGRFKKGINKKSNTITNVLYLLRKKNFFQKQAFMIDIQKNIPHGSGLGGGSSNAADVLTFFNSKMRLKLNKNEISKIAYQIGFDIPVSLEKKNTLLTGKKGEILRLNQKFRLNILIVYPNVICSTKKIYANNKNFTLLRPQSNFYIKDKKKLIDFLKNEIYFPESVNKKNIDEYLFFITSDEKIDWLDEYNNIYELKSSYINSTKRVKTKYKQYTIYK